MNPQSYIFVFGIENSNWEHYIDESIYTIEAINEQSIKVKNPVTGLYERKVNKVDLNPHKCTKEDIKAFNVRTL